MNIYRYFVVLSAISLLSGCASIIDGSTQTVSVKTVQNAGDVMNANCTLTNDKGSWFLATPGSVAIHRAAGDLSVTCKRDDFISANQGVKSSVKGLLFGNLLFGGLIGIIVDLSSGSAYDYPQLITIPMTSSPKVVAAIPTS